MKEPKDYHLARRAYEAFWGEQPQIWFDQLSHEYQIRWVAVARAVVKDAEEYKKHTPLIHTGVHRLTEEEARSIIKDAPKRAGGTSDRVDHQALTPTESKRVKEAYAFLKSLRESRAK